MSHMRIRNNRFARGLDITKVQVEKVETNLKAKVFRYEFFNVFNCPYCGIEIKERWGFEYRPRCARKTPCCKKNYAMFPKSENYTQESYENDQLHLQMREFISLYDQSVKSLKDWHRSDS